MEMGVEQADGMLKDIDGTHTVLIADYHCGHAGSNQVFHKKPSGRPVDVKITSVITMARRKPKFSLKTA